MTDVAALRTALGAALGRPVAELTPVAGGDLNAAFAATLDDGARVFVKTSADAVAGAYAAEADGLRWLAAADALPLPRVVAVADADPADGGAAPASSVRFLALEWVEPGPAGPDADEALGRGLARLHAAGAPSFGGPGATLVLGSLALPNAPADDWAEFYATRRLLPLARLAHDRGALPDGTGALLERVLARLPALAGPAEPPARLHGDLWSGNVLTDRHGRPWLIDPAAHGGHREVDLAMLRLFGGPSERCFAAYEEVAPLAPGAAERVGLWQLAPLLVHAALFGGGYGARAAAVLRRYA